MKSFTEKLNEAVKPYEDKDIRSIIYEMVDNNLSLNNDANSLSISGKEELVEKIFNLMQIENLKETIDVYKSVSENPKLIHEECSECEEETPKKVKKPIKIAEEPDDLEKDEKIEKKEDKNEK